MRFLFVFGLMLFGVQVAQALPAQVMIIRHAEKPESGPHLSPEGVERARGLVSFFTQNQSVLQFGVPVAIYAAEPAAEGKSVRSIETVTPLAQHLGLQIKTDLTSSETTALANAVLSNPAYNGKSVLICWPHSEIPQIATAFGVQSAPAKWPGEVFDRVWMITFNANGTPQFANLPQRVLPGDSFE
jgi:hypothetical protein